MTSALAELPSNAVRTSQTVLMERCLYVFSGQVSVSFQEPQISASVLASVCVMDLCEAGSWCDV